MDKTYLLNIIIADAYLKGVTEILLDGSAAQGKKNVFFRMGSALKGYMEIPGDAANGIISKILDAYQQYLRIFYRKDDISFLAQRLLSLAESNGQKELVSEIKHMLGGGQDILEPSQINP